MMRAGQAISVYDPGLSSTSPVSVGTQFGGPGPLSLDMHEGIEVGIQVQGAQERQWQDYTCVARPGDCWLCATWEPHGYRVLEPDSRDVVVVFLPSFLGDEVLGDKPWLSLFAAPPSERPGIGDLSKQERVLALGHGLLKDRRDEESGWETGVRLDLLKVLFVLSRGWMPPVAMGSPARTRAGQLVKIMPALRLVHSNLVRRVSVAEAAAACQLSRTQFCLIFKQSLGLSFGEFALRARLAAAAKRLMDTDLPVDVIADETGFSSASHLHSSFTKRYRCTPTHYRQGIWAASAEIERALNGSEAARW